MQAEEEDYCELTPIRALVMTWNAGASTPYHLQHSSGDQNFFRDLLQSSDGPDILVFGFQELVDLEDKKTTASKFASSITGFSWLNDPDDDYKGALNSVKILAVKDENSKLAPNQYFKPSQSTLALKQYPLTRDLYVINCTGKKDLGTNFAYFILNENGQRVILRSGILPNEIPEREINIKHTF